jgi:hypothetical protein
MPVRELDRLLFLPQRKARKGNESSAADYFRPRMLAFIVFPAYNPLRHAAIYGTEQAHGS